MLFLHDEKWTVKLKMADVIDFVVGRLIYIYCHQTLTIYIYYKLLRNKYVLESGERAKLWSPTILKIFAL